jgi:hypothetical protein
VVELPRRCKPLLASHELHLPFHPDFRSAAVPSHKEIGNA